MKPTIESTNRRTQSKLILFTMLLITILLATGCSAGPQATPTAQIVTVVETVPVEVTRIVEVLNTVEVTREVVVTVVVEVPVTQAPTPTVARATAQPAATISYIPTPTPLVQQFEAPKTEGVSRLKLDNTTEENLTARISGTKNYDVELPPGKSAFLNVPYGAYTVRVYNGDKRLYTVRVNCINPDKYTIILAGDDANVIEP